MRNPSLRMADLRKEPTVNWTETYVLSSRQETPQPHELSVWGCGGSSLSVTDILLLSFQCDRILKKNRLKKYTQLLTTAAEMPPPSEAQLRIKDSATKTMILKENNECYCRGGVDAD